MRSFTCPTFFFFHVGNAVESADGSTLCVDVAAYDDPEILLDLGLGRLRQPALGPDGALQRQVSRSSYRRLTIPLTGPDGGRLQVGAARARRRSRQAGRRSSMTLAARRHTRHVGVSP